MLSDLPYHVRFWITLVLTVVLSALAGHFLKKRFPGHWPGRKVTPLAALALGLFLWGAWDLWTYCTVGREVAAYYGQNIIRHLAQNDLIHGAIKLLLGGVALLVDWQRSREKKLCPSLRAVTWLLTCSIMGTWLTVMACLTIVTAQEIYDQLYEESYDFPEHVSQTGLLNEFYDQSFSRYGYHHERPDFWENQLLEAISYNTDARYRSEGHYGSDDRSKLIRDMDYPMETAVLFYDGEGNLLHSSEEDILYFSYFTQDEWDAGRDTTSGLHYGWMDVSEGKDAADPKEDPWRPLRQLYADNRLRWDMSALRVSGVFDGTELIPVTVHYVTDAEVRQVVENTDQFSTGPGSYSYIVSDVDRTGRLEWQLLFDRSVAHQGEELVTVYLDRPNMWDYQGAPLAYNGSVYESLADLTEALDFPSWAGVTRYSSELREAGIFGLDELLVFDGRVYADYQGFDYSSGREPEVEFTLVTAIRSHPLSCAVSTLRNLYIVTGLLALALLLAVRNAIKNRLLQPVTAVADAMGKGWETIYPSGNAPSPWREAAELTAGYAAEQDWRRMKDNEITRLNTALTYAKTAEENRRQMTSHIAHELKTPLAVIHSYAEGLKEHIAEDKRDKYIDVILSETERMDNMVLEMLDLSRLEAGKVKLARDQFSLEKLTRSVFERLEIAVDAKDLHLTYVFPEDSAITADEGRIAQVVENFATNAVKYTPPGGNIAVSVTRNHRGVTFAVANDCAPLSQEALDKVWDTFYRGDEARSGGGTGLGLAIAKRIIDLHGGKCSVENSKSGVIFQFTLP